MKITVTILIIVGLYACKQNKPTSSDTALSHHLVLENDKIKVTEYSSVPGGDVCGEGRHSHPRHLTVLLTDAKVKIMLADGRILNQNAPAGTTFWSEAETHTVTNNGTTPTRAYIIEPK